MDVDYLLSVFKQLFFYLQFLGVWLLLIMLEDRAFHSRNTKELLNSVLRERFVSSMIVLFIFPISCIFAFGIWFSFEGIMCIGRQLKEIDKKYAKNRRNKYE